MVESWTRGLSSLKGNSQLCCERAEDSAPPPDRPKWRRAGSRAGQTNKETKEKVEDRPRTYLNGGELVQSTFLTLTFAFALGFMATFALPLILAFLFVRDKILTFWGATVKKGVSWTRESSLEPVAGPWPLPRGT